MKHKPWCKVNDDSQTKIKLNASVNKDGSKAKREAIKDEWKGDRKREGQSERSKRKTEKKTT